MRIVPSTIVVLALTCLASSALGDAAPEPRRKDVPYSLVVDNVSEIRDYAIVLYPWHEAPGSPWTLGVFAPGLELTVDPEVQEAKVYRVKKDKLGSLRVEVERAKNIGQARMALALAANDCGLTLSKHEQVGARTATVRVRRHLIIDTHLLCEVTGGSRDYVEGEPNAPGLVPATRPVESSGTNVAPSASATPSARGVPAPSATPEAPAARTGCGACALGTSSSRGASGWLAGLLGLALRRRRQRPTRG